ncbi:MAG: hypothetical protein HWQ35_08650 [Nostoc sp. NMS1]|uniref:hypothetical protein n=2 Tax=unclassified Nostoc TaxID=2593658 RepID=UPI0025F2442F|nr:hypothetical protein [Nostoc sp. NMS2]MBN3906613.1 hypothetical protein [Nostoc sp. NMS1]
MPLREIYMYQDFCELVLLADADGNPRLLEWLDKILQNTTVDVVAILNRLAVDPSCESL